MHPHQDGSLHLMLPGELMDAVEEAGRCVRHPVQRSTLVFGPRNPDELEIVWMRARASHAFVMDLTGSSSRGR